MPTFEQDETNDAIAADSRHSERVVVQPGVPRLLVDRYEVLEEIGSGATAVTYRGHDRRLDRDVAIKILRQDHALDSNYVQRFEREARAAASVSQGNVVDVYDFGEQDDSLYIVMQYIDGEDLKHNIARHGALESRRARQLTTQILSGLAAIHAAGIIHRDIKPQNVLIGRDGIARVTDFGVAQAAIDVGLTTAGTTVGTAAYMAPEQAQAGTLSETTDIYAVGVVLYEMLTGGMPFSAPTPVAMMLAHIQQDPVPPSLQTPEHGIPADLDGIVMRAMAKNPADRFRSASAMSQALAGVSTGTGATTVIAAVPAVAHGNPIPDSMRQAWPAASTMASGAPPEDAGEGIRSPRLGSGLRGAVGGLLLLLLLATTGGAAYFVNQIVGDTGDNASDPTVTVPAVVATGFATLTPTSGATEVPGIDATDEPTATEVPTERATDVPTEVPTQIPTTVPTAIPTEISTQIPTTVPTDVPTEVPIEAPTAVPTEMPSEPPTEGPLIEPADGPAGTDPTADGQGQGSNVANSSSGQSAQDTGNSQAVQNPGQITIEPNAWQGDGVQTAAGEDWMVVGPGEEATAAFDVNGIPSGGRFEVSIAIAAVDTRQVPIGILINGTERLEISDPLPTISSSGTEQTLGRLVLMIPSAALKDGRNEITIVNGAGTNDWAKDDDDDDDDGSKNGNGNGNGNQGNPSEDQSNGLESNSIVLADAVVTLAP